MFINHTEKATSSWIGGQPFLPTGFNHPTNSKNSPLTFFFTLAFPKHHQLTGLSLSFFFETQEFNEDLVIPEMLPAHNKKPAVSEHFLKEYQKNFKSFLFPTSAGVIQKDGETQINKQYLTFSDIKEASSFGYAGKNPNWRLEEETPGKCGNIDPVFALQVFGEQTFPIADSATGQTEMDIFGGSKKRKQRDYYFFNKNESYFFAYPSLPITACTYIITQCD